MSKIRTYPSHPLDSILPFLDMLKSNNVYSWQWKKNVLEPKSTIEIPAIEDNLDRAAIVKPINYSGEYRIGIRYYEKKRNDMCTILLKDKIAIKLQEDSIFIYAISYPLNKTLNLEMVEIIDVKNISKELRLISIK